MEWFAVNREEVGYSEGGLYYLVGGILTEGVSFAEVSVTQESQSPKLPQPRDPHYQVLVNISI